MCGTVDSLVDVWQDVSAPFVDTAIGRAALTIGTGGLAAPALYAYDKSLGKEGNLLGAIAGGYFGLNGGFDAATNAIGEAFGSSATITPIDFGTGEAFLSGPGGSSFSMPAMGSQQFGWDQPGIGASFSGSFSNDAFSAANQYNPAEYLGYTGADTGAVDLTGSGLGDLVSGNVPRPIDYSSQNLYDIGIDPNSVSASGQAMSTDPLSGLSNPFSLKDWLKSGGDNLTRAGRLQMLQGGLKTLGGLQDYQEKNRLASEMMSRYNEQKALMDKFYAPGSPEALAMEEAMARKDAAAGRNSQYGKRAANLAATLADIRARYAAQMAPELNRLSSSAGALRSSAPAGIYGGLSQLATGYSLANLF